MNRPSLWSVPFLLATSCALAACSMQPITITKIKVERIQIPDALLIAPPLPTVPVHATRQDAQRYVIDLWNYARNRKVQIDTVKKLNDAWKAKAKK